MTIDPNQLPNDPTALRQMVMSLLEEMKTKDRRLQQLQHWVEQLLRARYGPRADRLKTSAEVGQVLLAFGEELAEKAVPADEFAAAGEPASELRRVKRRRGRRALANFENLPVTTHIYELSGEERACPGCGIERKEIGAEVTWQIEYLPGRFERIRHVRKKYACAQCEAAGEVPQIPVATRADSPTERGLAGPGLLAYIVSSKFADYLPQYRKRQAGCICTRGAWTVFDWAWSLMVRPM